MAPNLSQAADAANKGTHDGTASRNTSAMDSFAQSIGIGSSPYQPPSDPALKEVYDDHFRRAESGR